MEAEPEMEGKPQILLRMLSELGILKRAEDDYPYENEEYKITSQCTVNFNNEIQNIIEDSSYKTLRQKELILRREKQVFCYNSMWEVLSFGGREVTKGLLINLIYTLLTLPDSQAMETKLDVLQQTLHIYGLDQQSLANLKELLKVFNEFAREAKESRHLTHFGARFKAKQSSTEEREMNAFKFAPSINNTAKVLKALRKNKSSPELVKENGCNAGNAKARQRSCSRKRYKQLYDNYYVIKDKLDKKRASNEFKPEINKSYKNRSPVKKSPKKEGYKPYASRIMDGCTFKPKIKGYKKPSNSPEPLGYDKAVERYRKHSDDKKKTKEANERAARGGNYVFVKERKAEPFNLSSNVMRPRNIPFVPIEIMPTAGKTVKINFYATDDPAAVAKNFAMIYNLSNDDQSRLKQLLQRQLASFNFNT